MRTGISTGKDKDKDRELRALAGIVEKLNGLPPQGVTRVMAYLAARYVGVRVLRPEMTPGERLVAAMARSAMPEPGSKKLRLVGTDA